MTDPDPASAPPRTIRILIADDHEVVRIGLVALLDRQPGFRVVAQAGSGADAVRLARSLRPNVAVLDIRMPNGSGIDACRTITAELPGTPVVMLTSYADSDALFDALWSNDDDRGYRVARQVLDGEHTWVEEGVLDPSGDGPMVAEQPERIAAE